MKERENVREGGIACNFRITNTAKRPKNMQKNMNRHLRKKL